MINVKNLGQSGFRFEIDDKVIYIDPYLSNSVESLEGEGCKRLFPLPFPPSAVMDADYVLITHIHQDHCDIDTLRPIYEASGQCIFIGPNQVCIYLKKQGFSTDRLLVVSTDWVRISPDLRVLPVPAAHPEIEKDEQGCLVYVGYLLENGSRRIYLAGDTFVKKEIIEFLERYLPIETAVLPVNEHNYFKEKLRIVGNMSMREAFEFAKYLQVKKLVPVHWDMFPSNRVFREEIELYYKLSQPGFDLLFYPETL